MQCNSLTNSFDLSYREKRRDLATKTEAPKSKLPKKRQVTEEYNKYVYAVKM